MKKVYHLSSCSTCQRIINELQPLTGFELQDIKADPITEKQLMEMYGLAGDFESLFSRRAVLYRERELKDKDLKETDIKALILEHYTFLKRPVLIVEDEIFIGNSKKSVAAAKKAIHS
ncbi:MAG: ArsC/Spx/MgsR family protein [Maribacter sp.]